MEIKYDVFISYSRKDYVDENKHVLPNNVLSIIKASLKSHGLSYWFDEEGIYSGQEFTSVITKAIRASAVFVFISSENSNASLWTSNEIAIAKRLNKPIIPFCLDDSPYNDSVMMLIAALDFIDGRDQNVAYTKLVRAINYYIHKDCKRVNAESKDDIPQSDSAQEKTYCQEHKERTSWYKKLVNPSFTFFQRMLVYSQLGIYIFFLLFAILNAIIWYHSGFHHFEVCQVLLILTLGVSLFSTIKLRTGRKLWWAVIIVCDFLVVLCAKYLLSSDPTLFHSYDAPAFHRYFRWLFFIGYEMQMGDHTLLSFVLLHTILICWSYYKNTKRLYRYLILVTAIMVPIYLLVSSNQTIRSWLSQMIGKPLPTLNNRELSTGKLYGMHEAVDLGLSVKWATCNIGAREPYLSGDYFAWGEVEPKDYYEWESYKYGNGDWAYDKREILKYCTDSIYGVVDDLTVLCDSDDAAQMLWGNGWRMPTYDEISELKENCTIEIKDYYGVKGMAVTGPSKKTIFIPFAGDVEGNRQLPDGENVYAIVWSSNLYEDNNYAYGLCFSVADNLWYRGERYTGHNIRAVHN